MLLRCESLEPAMSEMGYNPNCRPVWPAADITPPWFTAAVCQYRT